MLLDRTLRETLPVMQNRIMACTTYRGVEVKKCPLDMWVYSEILFHEKPTVVIEIGNWCGGSLLYLDDICRAAKQSTRFIGVDVDHSRVSELVTGSSLVSLIQGNAASVISQVSDMITTDDRVMVIEDSSHTYENTLSVMCLYGNLVTSGQYMIVEDTICHHGLEVGPSPGPMEAVAEYFRNHNDFTIDNARCGFGITWNPNGYLRKL